MLKLTEKVYLAAPFETPEQRAFNDQLAELVRSYNFPLFMPQEVREILLEQIPAGESVESALAEACMEVLSKANLVIAVQYGDEFDPITGFEVGYALGRRLTVVAVQNPPEASQAVICDTLRPSVNRFCSRVVPVPMDVDRLPDRLIPILNRYFIPH